MANPKSGRVLRLEVGLSLEKVTYAEPGEEGPVLTVRCERHRSFIRFQFLCMREEEVTETYHRNVMVEKSEDKEEVKAGTGLPECGSAAFRFTA